MTLFSCWATYIQIFLGIIHNIVTTTVTNSTGVEPVSHIYIIKPTCCQNNPAESFLLMHLHQFQYLSYLILNWWAYERMNESMNEWVWKRWKSEWMEERMNEQVVNKRYIYYGWILSEWVDECPKIADGANELVNIMQFILVTMHMITPSWYMCTYVCLHPTGYIWNTQCR